eukprot:1275894-Rhodomonas_salina.4
MPEHARAAEVLPRIGKGLGDIRLGTAGAARVRESVKESRPCIRTSRWIRHPPQPCHVVVVYLV